MSDKPEETVADEEYVKPNPQDNPRNQVLAEIAKTVAGQHENSAAETMDSIDDDGNITPAKDAPAAPAEVTDTAEVVEEQQEVAQEAAPVEQAPLATDAVDPNKMYKVKVDGQEMEVLGKAIIDAGYRTFQKETAADFRLKMASELLKEAEGKHREATPQGAHQPAARQEGPPDRSDADLANALQFGTPEQAAEAMATLRGRGAVSPEQIQAFAAQQARLAAQDELAFQDAMKFVNTEYKDLLANDYLKRLFFVEENRRRAPKERGGEGDRRPYKELYKSIGDDLRVGLNLPKRTSSDPAAPTPAGTVATRKALKENTPSVPRTAASRLSESAGAAKAPTPSEIIAGMAEKRGKTHLTQPIRKG